MELHWLHPRCAQQAAGWQLPAPRLLPEFFSRYQESALSPAAVPCPTTLETQDIETRGHHELLHRPQLLRMRSSERREAAQGKD